MPQQPSDVPVRCALISVSDKTELAPFAKQLRHFGFTIIATSSTAAFLRQHAITVQEVADYTGSPEILGGRIKTLHPKIYAGILARREADFDSLQQMDIPPIDLVVVNLYPFQQTIANPTHEIAAAIENIDIGGPTLIRAAAKNYQAVTVVIDPADYSAVIEEMSQGKTHTQLSTRLRLAQKAFAHIAQYDAIIARYFANFNEPVFPEYWILSYRKMQELRYGENPQQRACYYQDETAAESNIGNTQPLQGKELSFNNLLDANAALNCLLEFPEQPACVIVKHDNPCGVALGDDLLTAYQRAYACDPVAAFGGIIALNRALDTKVAQTILQQQFVEVLIAPAIDDAARIILQSKPNIRVLLYDAKKTNTDNRYDYKRIRGGLLVQETDAVNEPLSAFRPVSKRLPEPDEFRDLVFAWRVARHVKSNAIVLAKNQATLGIGAGQMSRVTSVRIALWKAEEAGLIVTGAVLASDAFFPFSDGVELATKAGIAAIIQPGGSVRDQEVILAADMTKAAMVFTGTRHFRH